MYQIVEKQASRYLAPTSRSSHFGDFWDFSSADGMSAAFHLSPQITGPEVSFSLLSRFEVVSRFSPIDYGDRRSGFPRVRRLFRKSRDQILFLLGAVLWVFCVNREHGRVGTLELNRNHPLLPLSVF